MIIRYLLEPDAKGKHTINGLFPAGTSASWSPQTSGILTLDEVVNAVLAADLLANTGRYWVVLSAQQKPELWIDPDWSDPNAT